MYIGFSSVHKIHSAAWFGGLMWTSLTYTAKPRRVVVLFTVRSVGIGTLYQDLCEF